MTSITNCDAGDTIDLIGNTTPPFYFLSRPDLGGSISSFWCMWQKSEGQARQFVDYLQ